MLGGPPWHRNRHIWTTFHFLKGIALLKMKMYSLSVRFFFAFHFTRCKLMDWSCVDYCDGFIRCLDSYYDGTHCRGSTGEQVMQGLISPKLIYILDSLRVSKYSVHLHFGVNCSFNRHACLMQVKSFALQHNTVISQLILIQMLKPPWLQYPDQ